MVKNYVDTFDRADNVSLGSDWSVSPAGQLQIVGNQAQMQGTSSALVAVYTLPTDTVDMGTKLTWKVINSTSSVITRVNASGTNYYYFRRASGTTGTIGKQVGATNTVLIGPFAATATVGGTFEIRAVGSTISAWVDGAKVAEVTDTEISTGNGGGWRSTSTSVTGTAFDNFTVFDVVSTPDTVAPTAPTLTSATAASTTAVNLTWTAATDDVAVTEYRISVNGIYNSTVTGLTTQITGLTPATTYSFTVVARDAAGNTSTGSSLSATTQGAADTTAPSAPVITVGNVGSTSATITWTAATDNVAVAGYRVLRNGTLVTTTSSLSTTLNGLSPSTTYSIVIQAYDAANNMTNSATASLTTTAGSATTYTLEWFDGTTYNQLDNAEFRAIRASTGQEVGFMYGNTLQLKLANGSLYNVTLPEGRPGISRWVGKSAVFYGDSSGVLQSSSGVDYTTSDLWPRLVGTGWDVISGDPVDADYPDGLQVTTVNRHFNSATMPDIAARMLATGTLNWVPGSFNIVSVFAGGNDVGILHNTEAGKRGYKHAVRSVLSILRTASRVTSFTETGTWSANSTLFSGNARVSTVPGSTSTITFTGQNATLFAIAKTDGTGSAFTYSLDGGAPVASTTKDQAAPGLLTLAGVPIAINFRNLSAGSHTVVITHTGSSGDPLIIDSVCPWQAAETSMPFVMVTPPPYSTTAGWSNYPTPKPTNADSDAFRVLLKGILTEYRFAHNIGTFLWDMIDTKFPPTNTSMRIADGLHPNKLGHKMIASLFLENLRLYTPTN